MIVGYLPGVFDLFHIGHLNIIKNAKASCDYLIVGLTSDERCKRTKGKNTVIPYSERAEIIEALRFVDKVVKLELGHENYNWEELNFSRIFVGDDWKGSDKWKKLTPYYEKNGVEIVYFPYTKSTSSTLLRSVLEKI